jgi:uroporphyrinogen decarboxylase
MLRVHHGFFLTMGVDDWQRFMELMDLLVEQVDVVRRLMEMQGEFAARLTEKVVKDVDIDAAIFSEPIGGNHGPLISPNMYSDLVLPSYRPVIDVLRRHSVDLIIVRTYANTRVLLPSMIDAGINCLWACEVQPDAMDYLDIRAEFGPGLRLIGGIDLDTLRGDKKDIRREVERVVPPLLEEGGYIPLADGRVREDIPYNNYHYYRQLLEKINATR